MVTDQRRGYSSPVQLTLPIRDRRAAMLCSVVGVLLAMAACSMPHIDAAQDSHADTPASGPAEPARPPEPADDTAGLTIADASAGEADGVVRFTVSLGVASGAPVTVAYETEDGRAKAGADYEAASGRLTFAAESTVAQQIEVRLRDDPVDESPETFTVRLSDPQGTTLAVTTATGTILDDDTRALAVKPSELYVTEGHKASYEVTLGSEPTAPVTVAVTAGTETGALTVDPDRLTFTRNNWNDAQEVTLTAAQDNDALADAPVELAHMASGGGYDGVAGPAVTVTIVEDDVATLAMAAAHASEQARRIVFEVTLSQASDEAVTVDYATTGSSDDTATAGKDYTPTSGMLRFPARSTAARAVAVTVNDDALNEDTEMFTVTLRNAANAQLAGGGETLTASGRIEDEDPLPELRIGDGSLTEGSGDGRMPFVVRLDPASGRTVTVQYATANVTATAGRDYTRVSGTLTFGAGTTLRTVMVPITDDALDEQDSEQFTVTLLAAVNATVGTAHGTGTIADNDQAPELNIADSELTEGSADGRMRFMVRLAATSGRTVTVQYGTADGTATAGTDYTAVSGTLTFRAGTTTATIDVPILDDSTGEEPETFTVTLSNATGAMVSDAAATGTIADDDDSTITDPVGPDNSTPLELSSLEVTGGGTMYPPFDADILHYALTCSGSPTLSVAAETERAGAQLTLLRADAADNEASTTGTLNARVTVGGDHDVAIEVSDDGQTRTYVVHCLPDSFPTVNILTKTDQVKDGLLLLTPTYVGVTFLTVLDNNGVPRFHRLLTGANFWAMNFKYHGGGRYSVARRPVRNRADSSFGNWRIDLLNNKLQVTSTVTTVSPLSQTDGHDFQITSGGHYVMLAYYDDELRDFRPYGGSASQRTHDSVIQRRTAAGVSQFTWNSWDHRDVLRVGNDCKVGSPIVTYAHLNGLQLLSDGDFVASFRGCSQVLRIDGSTGAVVWKLGGTAPPDDSGAEFLELVEHSDDDVIEEFCGQHQVTLTSSNTVVMYDNGVQCIGARKNSAAFSRAVEYDISSGTQAEYKREYRLPGTHGYFPYRGGVHVLQGFGGSVHWLINWGGSATGRTVALDRTIAVSEVDPANRTAHLEVNMYKGSLDAWSYRVYRVPESAVDLPRNLP